MRKASIVMCGIALLGLVTITACTERTNADSARSTSETTPAVAGWVPVMFHNQIAALSQGKGNLFETYDEFVGGLVDDGLDANKATWLKPTYGNQNMLWVPDAKFGEQKKQRLLQSKSNFPSTAYEFYDGTMKLSDDIWSYVGYLDKTTGSGAKAFQMFIFVCKGTSPGISVFYWGDGIAVHPYEIESTSSLLSQLSHKCN